MKTIRPMAITLTIPVLVIAGAAYAANSRAPETGCCGVPSASAAHDDTTNRPQPTRDVRPEDRLVFDGDNRALALLARDISKNQVAPSVWLGVRLTPLPEALAAHFGNDGMMIANVAAHSPSADAGLEQFDILRAIDGQTAVDMDAVIASLSKVAIGDSVELTVVRKGKQLTQSIEPVSRPVDPAAIEYLYQEPAPDFSTMDVRGKRLQMGPNGQWQVEDLGPMNQPFGSLPGLDRFDLKNWNQWTPPQRMPPVPGPGFDDLSDLNRWRMFLPHTGSATVEENSELSISVNENGEKFSVQRHADGTYDIETTDANGNVNKAHFDDEEAFSTEDPDAYRRFRELTQHRSIESHFGWNGQVDTLPPMPDDMRQRMESILQRARALDRDLQMKTLNNVTNGIQNMTSIQIVDDKITIRTNDNGELHTYEFDNADQMKAEAPQVYERVRTMFE